MELREIIYGNQRERIFTDGTEIGGIICPLIKMNNWEVYIYGGGEYIEAVVLYLWNLGIEVKGILDCDVQKEGKKVLDKVIYINPMKIREKYNSENTFAIINTLGFKGIEQYEIIKLLFEKGITKFYELSETEKNEIKEKPHTWADVGRFKYYQENIDELETFYNQLYDEKSKETMLEYIRVYMQYGVYSLKQCSSDVKYFYGKDNDVKEELYIHLDDEVWVNCGSNNGDNIFWYFANNLNAKIIYAYEGDRKNFNRLVKNMNYLPEKHKNIVVPVNEFINDKTNWEVLKTNRVTLINADIEGGELDLLKSMKEKIATSRPVIAMCAYHRADDLVELPKYIQSIVEDYCFALRKYESNVENVRRASELVLYAIPKERIGAGIKKE